MFLARAVFTQVLPAVVRRAWERQELDFRAPGPSVRHWRLEGALTRKTLADWHAFIRKHAVYGSEELVVDLAGLSFADPQGVGALYCARWRSGAFPSVRLTCSGGPGANVLARHSAVILLS
jgi:hypothetical protein